MSMSVIILLVFWISSLFGFVEGQSACSCSAYDKVEDKCELKLMEEGGGNCQDEQIAFLFEQDYSQDGDPQEWPYLISLQLPVLNRPAGCYQHYCTGILISGDVVITAAHCVDPIIEAAQGELPITLQASRAPPCRNLRGDLKSIRNVVYAVKHPDWMSNRGINNTYNADLALLKLDSKLDPPYAQISNLSPTQFQAIIDARTELFSAGYNKFASNEAEYFVLPMFQNSVSIVSQLLCDFFTESYGGFISVQVFDNETLICGYSPRSYGCQLDSGTPLINRGAATDGGDLLIGLAAYGERIRCDNNDMHQAPVFYTKISTYYKWIQKTIKELANKQVTIGAQEVIQQNVLNQAATILLPKVPNPDQK